MRVREAAEEAKAILPVETTVVPMDVESCGTRGAEGYER